MVKIITAIVFILSISESIGQNTLSPEYLSGKWRICYQTSNDSTYSIGTDYQCSGEWNFNFSADLRFKWNKTFESCGVTYDHSEGRYLINESSITIDYDAYCGSVDSPPNSYDNIIIVNENKWYSKMIEIPDSNNPTYAYIIFERVK